jgi:RNA polymerase sigma factor (sigma-70 family)
MIAPARTAPRVRLPRSVPVLRLLHERGVVLVPQGEEGVEDCEARIETALMALFRDTHSPAAFEALHDYARFALLQRVLALARAGDDPLDLLQDAFVNIYLYAATFRDEHDRSFRVWARTIAGNVVRRSRLRGRRRSLYALPEGLQEPCDGAPGPAAEVAWREECLDLSRAWLILLLRYAAAFAELGARDRRALELVEIEGRGYREAARVLGVGLSNMKMILFRARQRIRLAVGRELAEGCGRLAARTRTA